MRGGAGCGARRRPEPPEARPLPLDGARQPRDRWTEQLAALPHARSSLKSFSCCRYGGFRGPFVGFVLFGVRREHCFVLKSKLDSSS